MSLSSAANVIFQRSNSINGYIVLELAECPKWKNLRESVMLSNRGLQIFYSSGHKYSV